ncbi:hypothetical protein [Bathymodiolus thermophilus thioautotrophic gill symbiont]|uniref:Uncharacterized protein n=1 Tax=Bathymodiolus thermophilus thioautotrophic gill symbiont TaxID=2360 RepID=A0A8H8XCX5_9GAMM|nr:hypothetical protein [Bathymodiolus thermophilus thioautotrophic gill symbiont]CAB5498360.1 hypothetical protein THERMOS_832 [Bathymodiolus thermophilus thioautotrophic gill symbiont]
MDNSLDIQQYKSNPLALFNYLYKIKINDYEEESGELKKMIIELHNNHNIDICEYAIKAIESKFNCLNANDVLINSIAYLNLNLTSYCNYLGVIFQYFGSNSFQYKLTSNLLKEQPNITKKLLNKLTQQDEAFIVEHISIILTKLYGNSYVKIINLINKYNIFTTQGAILALGNLKHENNSTDANKILDTFEKSSENIEDLGEVTTISLLKIQHLGKGFKLQILKLIKTNNLQIHFQVSQHLSLRCETLSNEKWFEKSLMSFNKTNCEYRNIINNLDFWLSNLIKFNKPLFKKFFISWIIHSDYSQSKSELQDLFKSTFRTISEDKKLLQELITDYFNHDNRLINQAGAKLTLFFERNKVNNIEFDRDILKTLNIDDITYMCRKMLGYLIDVKTLCSLSYSILTVRIRNKRMSNIVINIFIDYIGCNYLSTTLDFLNDKISTKGISKSLRIALQLIIDELNNKKKILELLPRLNELKPSKQKIHQEELANRKQMNKLITESQKGSLVSCFSKIYLKYGTGSCNYRSGNYSELSYMNHFSHSIEIPRAQIVHPVSLALENFRFRLVKRGEN